MTHRRIETDKRHIPLRAPRAVRRGPHSRPADAAALQDGTISDPSCMPSRPREQHVHQSSALVSQSPTALLKIVYKDPGLLKPRVANPRTHTPKQIRQIATSIEQFGFINPVLIDATDGIVAGHARVMAAKTLCMTHVPTVRVDHLTSAQIRAYVIADNKLAESAGWDRSLLALELQEFVDFH